MYDNTISYDKTRVENVNFSTISRIFPQYWAGYAWKKLALIFVFLQSYISLFFIFDWQWGVLRGFLILGILFGLVILRYVSHRTEVKAQDIKNDARLNRILKVAVIGAVLLNCCAVGYAVSRSIKSDSIPLDLGQTTWRSARLILQGQNPYGFGAIVDFNAFFGRETQRRADGVVSTIEPHDFEKMLSDYDKSLSTDLRETLMPVAEKDRLTSVEASILGYKYGPILLYITTMMAPLGVPAVVLGLNALAWGIMIGGLHRLLSVSAKPAALGLIGLLAILLDRQISWNYLNQSATDVWALAFCAWAVWCFQRRNLSATAVLLAFAMGCKTFPSAVFLPLLFVTYSYRPILLFAATSLAIFSPWLIWDPIGLFYNVIMWPVLTVPNTTGWVYFVPLEFSVVLRAAFLVSIFIAWYRYIRGLEERLFWTLAMVNTLLLMSGNVLHNNYLPWASIWIVAALVEAFSRMPQAQTALSPVAQARVMALPRQGA